MEDWQKCLRDGDPVSREPSLNAEDVDRIRRAVLTAEPVTGPHVWFFRLTVVTGAVAALAGGFWLQAGGPDRLRQGSGESAVASAKAESPPYDDAAPQRRQVQFATPGGTRVIWVFDSKFDMR